MAADKKVYEFQEVSTVLDTDLFLVARSYTTNSVRFSTLKTNIVTDLLSKNQGTQNAGKLLVVGNDGNITFSSDDPLITKTITENGTYHASDDGAYGYKTVNVSGIGVATGKAPDGSGDSAQATVDPTTGEIEIKKIPSSIKITTPPTRLEYNDGDLIDFSNMVVKAFLKSGAVFTDERYPDGVIPQSEWITPVLVADYSQTIPPGSVDAYSPKEGWPSTINNLTLPQHYAEFAAGTYTLKFMNIGAGYETYQMTLNSKSYLCLFNGGSRLVIASDDSYSINMGNFLRRDDASIVKNGVSYRCTTFYDWSWKRDVNHNFDIVPINTGWSNGSLANSDFICLIYGNAALPISGIQKIPVQWLSPYGKGDTLQDEFEITVNPAPEPDPDPYPDPNDGVDAVTGADPVAEGENP